MDRIQFVNVTQKFRLICERPDTLREVFARMFRQRQRYLPFEAQFIPGPIVFLAKALILIFIQMWMRWSLPRLRVDQLMYVNWKVLMPIAFVLILGAGWLAIR